MASKIQASVEKNKLFEALLNDEGDSSAFKTFIKRAWKRSSRKHLKPKSRNF